jgi:HK97 family phage major capsid protein
MALKDLLQKRNALVEKARAINDAAEKEGRALTDEESRNFDQAMADATALKTQIDRAQRLREAELEVAAEGGAADAEDGEARGGRPAGAPEARTIGAGRFALRLDDVPAEQRSMIEARASDRYNAAFRSWLRTGDREARALDAQSGPGGAFVVAPVQFAQRLIQAMDDICWIRPLATVELVPSALSLGIPSLDADPADDDWTSELATGAEDSAMKFGNRELKPYPLAKRLKVSNRLLRIASLDVEGLVTKRLSYKTAIPEEKAFLTGDGANKPLGVFTASNNGIPTTRDVSSGNTTTAFTYDGLVNAKYALKGPYQAKAKWLFHRDGISALAKLKDSQNRPLWQPAIQLGQPDMLLGIPVLMSEYVPNVFTTGKYVGAIADWSFYNIADALDIQIQRLNELYAETNQTGFIVRKETDGMPVLAEAFARVTLA